MKDFCQQADVIIPNLTEAALLTGSPYLEEGSYDMTIIENLLRDLSRLGPRKVILTGISFETEKIGLAYFDKEIQSSNLSNEETVSITFLWEQGLTDGHFISRIFS